MPNVEDTSAPAAAEKKRSPRSETRVFVTGAPRSGTTLLDKLLSAHPEARVFSQPLPLLYVRIKAAFLQSTGTAPSSAAGAYPLNDMIGANFYSPAEFQGFLEKLRLDVDLCRRVLTEMVPFSGQYTKPDRPLDGLAGYTPASLEDFVSHYLRSLLGAERPRVVGCKESYCEEYIPYFLQRGRRVIAILRDPRDLVTSLDYGRGARFGGRRRPLLFNLRQWRKSVAFALAHREHPRFFALRYEDLVREPRAWVERLTGFLGLDPLPPGAVEGELRTAAGAVWRSNSSHRQVTRITADSVGRYRRHLPAEIDRLIQATCLCELRVLGYPVELDEDDVLPVLTDHRDGERLERPALARYAWSEARRDEEAERWRLLREGVFEARWFLFSEAFEVLARPSVSSFARRPSEA